MTAMRPMRKLPARPGYAVLLGLLAVGMGPGPARAVKLPPSALLERPALTLPPADLLAAADLPVPDGTGTLMLAREAHFRFDAKGRRTATYRAIFKVLTASTARSFGPLEAEWSPWHEERPRLSARVISRDGVVHPVDPRTFDEQPVSRDDGIHSDRRTLRAPLPGLQAGSVVEYEMSISESQPLFGPGTADRFFFVSSLPTRHWRLILEAPSSLPLRYVHRKLSHGPQRSEGPTGVRVVFDEIDVGPIKPGGADGPGSDAGAPPGVVPPLPHVAFSTGASWAEVASGYSRLVEERLSGQDLGGLATQVAAGARDRQLLLRRLVRYLHNEIRYTGVELGDASIVPVAPKETLSRKFGDCKDQATLLVGLLQKLGVSASVALLSSGSGPDVDPELPGLGLFNHAIVYVAPHKGAPAVWIDPTQGLAQPGVLPFEVQGRQALLAGAGVTGLVRIPQVTPAQNRVREQRDVTLTPLGPGRVVELTEADGGMERSLRRSLKQMIDANNLQGNYEKYATEVYGSGAGLQVHIGDPEDLSVRLQLRLTVPAAKVAYSADLDAVVYMPLATLLGYLPADLRQPLPEGWEQKGPVDEPSYAFEPVPSEIIYRIVPPPGFRAAPLPASGELVLGAARLHRRYSLAADGVVTAELRLDPGSGRLTRAEYWATRRAIAELMKGDVPRVLFEHTGYAHLAAGRVPEALAEFRRLVAAYPKESVYYGQYAEALVRVGLGEQARRMAERGVQLAPERAHSHRMLGFVLMHDPIGRQYQPGWDRDGAAAALRKAASLDPSDTDTHEKLALVLERDASGGPYGARDLLPAIASWRAAVAAGKDNPQGEPIYNLFDALMNARRYDELAAVTGEMPKGPGKNLALVLGMALAKGPAAALEAARSIDDREAQRAAVEAAGKNLAGQRRFTEAVTLLSDASLGSEAQTRLAPLVEFWRKVRRWDEPVEAKRAGAGQAQPLVEDLARRFFGLLIIDAEPGVPRFRALLSPGLNERLSPAQLAAAQAWIRAGLVNPALPRATLADMYVSDMPITSEGSDALGYRVVADIPHGNGRVRYQLYVEKHEGRYRVIATDRDLSLLGVEALRRADSGDLPGSRQLLTWARGEFEVTDFFGQAWTAGESGSRDRVRRAALVLACAGREGPLCTAALQQQAIGVLSGPGDDATLASLLERSERFTELLPVAERMLKRGEGVAELGSRFKIAALAGLGRFAEARRVAESLVSGAPERLELWQLVSSQASYLGDFAGAENSLRQAIRHGLPERQILNNLVWLQVMMGQRTEQMQADMRRLVEAADYGNHSQAHTLGTLLAEAGKHAEALAALRKSADKHGLLPSDWYIVGRLAETYGEREAATAAYQRVAPEGPRPAPNAPGTTGWLAEKRLRAIAQKR